MTWRTDRPKAGARRRILGGPLDPVKRPRQAARGAQIGLVSTSRMKAAADSQQGRLFIGFAAAELLGLLAFVVAMILLFVA